MNSNIIKDDKYDYNYDLRWIKKWQDEIEEARKAEAARKKANADTLLLRTTSVFSLQIMKKAEADRKPRAEAAREDEAEAEAAREAEAEAVRADEAEVARDAAMNKHAEEYGLFF